MKFFEKSSFDRLTIVFAVVWSLSLPSEDWC